MVTPSDRGRYERDGGHATQETVNPNDPIEREIDSVTKLLDQVLLHAAESRTIVSDMENLVKWWGRMKLLFSMYKPGYGIPQRLAAAFASRSLSPLSEPTLSEAQHLRVTDHLKDNIAGVRLRIELILQNEGLKRNHTELVKELETTLQDFNKHIATVHPSLR